MKKIKTPIALFVEREGNPPTVIQSYFPEWQEGQENVNCPWHEDTKASLHIHPSGKAYCHGCHAVAKDLIELVAKLEEKTYEEATVLIHNAIVDPIPMSQLQAYHKVLLSREDAMEYLLYSRNLTPKTIDDYLLGLNPRDNRIVIPILNEFGSCVNIRRMGWLLEHERKALNRKDHGEARLYPEQALVLTRRVLLCEGEYDCLVARQFGLPAFTWTCGATSWNDSYNYLFRGKAVWILYDNDRGGREGTQLVLNKLFQIAHRMVVVEPFGPKGKDITDWSFHYPERFRTLRDEILQYQFPVNVEPVKICPYCKQPMKGEHT